MNGVYQNLTNSLPVDSFADVGSAVGEMNTQFGFMDKQLEDSSEYLLKFANINEADVSNSAINARKAIEAYNLTNQDFNSVLDAVTKTAQNTGQAVDSLFDKAIKGAPQIKQLGLSFDEGVALMGKFEQSGVDSGKAISYLSKASVVYAKDNKSLLQGLEETSKKINNATSQTEALQIATEVFGTKGASVMEDAIARGALNLDGLADSAENTSGVVAQTFEDTLDPIDRQQVALNNVKNVMAEFGASIAEALAPVLNTLIPVIQKIAELFTGLPTPIKQFIVILGGLIVLLTSIAPIITAIGVVGIGALAPIIGIMAGIAAAVTIAIGIFKNWGSIWDWIKGVADGATSGIRKALSEVGNTALSVVGKVKDTFTNGFQRITDFVQEKIESIKSFFGSLKLKLPKFELPQMPHFELKMSSKKILGKNFSFPTGIDVKWFAEGGILTKPTIFGTDGNKLLGGGEAGKEAIAPLDKLMGYIRQAVKEESSGKTGDEIHLHLNAFGNLPKEIMDQMAEYLLYKFTDLKNQKNPFGGGDFI